MKKIYLFLTVALLMTLISGCVGSNDNGGVPSFDAAGPSSGNVPDSSDENLLNQTGPAETSDIRIRMRFDGGEATAVLIDNPSVRSLLAQLPVAVTCADYADSEKIVYFPERLSSESSSAGYNPAVGDVTCYGPWGNLAVFYRDQPYAGGLIYMGRIESGLDLLTAQNGAFEMVIERAA